MVVGYFMYLQWLATTVKLKICHQTSYGVFSRLSLERPPFWFTYHFTSGEIVVKVLTCKEYIKIIHNFNIIENEIKVAIWIVNKQDYAHADDTLHDVFLQHVQISDQASLWTIVYNTQEGVKEA